MLAKLAYAQRVLRALAAEKQAGVMGTVAAGGLLVGGAAAMSKGRKKAREYHAGFTPGLADSRVEL